MEKVLTPVSSAGPLYSSVMISHVLAGGGIVMKLKLACPTLNDRLSLKHKHHQNSWWQRLYIQEHLKLYRQLKVLKRTWKTTNI